jgi:hypothetical protein
LIAERSDQFRPVVPEDDAQGAFNTSRISTIKKASDPDA